MCFTSSVNWRQFTSVEVIQSELKQIQENWFGPAQNWWKQVIFNFFSSNIFRETWSENITSPSPLLLRLKMCAEIEKILSNPS